MSLFTIEIENPPINTDVYLKRFSLDFGSEGTLIPTLLRTISQEGITPETHPKAADVCAGVGSIAKIISELGWRDVTCFDRERVPEPEWPTWRYLDLASLGRAIIADTPLPEQVERLRYSFDLVLAVQSELSSRYLPVVCDFLTRAGGYCYPDWTSSMDLPNWRSIRSALYLKLEN